MDLMSAAEAVERWPFEFYDDDTAGGMQRRIILDFWELAEDMPPEVAALFGESIARQHAELEAKMEEGLRTAFHHVMGYELP